MPISGRLCFATKISKISDVSAKVVDAPRFPFQGEVPCLQGSRVLMSMVVVQGAGCLDALCVYLVVCLRKKRRAREELRISSFNHFSVPKVYFDFKSFLSTFFRLDLVALVLHL